jgi:hypothetical protein
LRGVQFLGFVTDPHVDPLGIEEQVLGKILEPGLAWPRSFPRGWCL